MKEQGFILQNSFEIKPVILDCCLGVDGFGSPGILIDTYNNSIDRENSTTFLKSITLNPRKGNYGASIFKKSGWAMTDYGFPLPKMLCYTPIGFGSTTNSVGLTNDGFDNFLGLEFAQDYVIPSIFFEFGKGTNPEIRRVKEAAQYMGRKLNDVFSKTGLLKAIVINISCPNYDNGVCQFVNDIIDTIAIFKEASGNTPIGIKYSYMQDVSLAVKLDNNVEIDFHQAINTVPYKVVFGDKRFSPLSHIGHGGVSGPAITKMALNYAKKLRCALPNAKIIGSGGISNIKDANERAFFCDSIGMGILVSKNANEANKIINYFK